MPSNDSLDYLALIRESKRLAPPSERAFRLAILSDAATQQLSALLRVLLMRRQIECAIYEAPFAAIDLEVYDGSSDLYRLKPDAVLILNVVQALVTRFSHAASREAFASDVASGIERTWHAIQSHMSVPILQSTFALPIEKHFGNFDQKIPESFFASVLQINAQICELARGQNSVLINDLESVASWLGRKQWFDDRLWDMAKTPCALDCLPYLAENTAQIITALRGRITKCVILDLDNTLWGGVIGDDGLEGIKLNAHGEGEAFYRLQLFLLELSKRGILLAVCSKNDMANAVLPFEKHREMVLKLNHIACFVANWNDKAENIRQIKEQLNIGYDSMVFLDDNPFERNLVRGLLPEVIVPELPEDPAEYVRFLCEQNLFECISFSAEDRQRTEMYRQQAERRRQEGSFSNFEEYLQSLEMKLVAGRFDAYHLPRIAQLFQRSNQFNLKTTRRTEADCAELMVNEGFIPLYSTLSDRLGDHGLISIIVLENVGDELAIRDWLMSCRVLKRGVEQTMMNLVFAKAAELGVQYVTGEYCPTTKNAMVKGFFAEFGFELVFEKDGSTGWSMATDAYVPLPTHIQTTKLNFEVTEEPAACRS